MLWTYGRAGPSNAAPKVAAASKKGRKQKKEGSDDEADEEGGEDHLDLNAEGNFANQTWRAYLQSIENPAERLHAQLKRAAHAEAYAHELGEQVCPCVWTDDSRVLSLYSKVIHACFGRSSLSASLVRSFRRSRLRSS